MSTSQMSWIHQYIWILHTWTFDSWTYLAVHRDIAGGQNASMNYKGGQNAGHFMGQEGKMLILSKHFIYCTDGQVN